MRADHEAAYAGSSRSLRAYLAGCIRYRGGSDLVARMRSPLSRGSRPSSRRSRRAAKGGKSISRTRWNDGYHSNTGPSRGGACRIAFRPYATIAVPSATGRSHPLPTFEARLANERDAPETGPRLNAYQAPIADEGGNCETLCRAESLEFFSSGLGDDVGRAGRTQAHFLACTPLQVAGGTPNSRLKARLNASSDSYPTK